MSPFKEWNPWVAAGVVGAGYTALVRLQFTTIQLNGKDTPFGLETFYEALKGLVHRRINRIIRAWRVEKCGELAKSDINTLRETALMMVEGDALMADAERNSTKAWIEQTAGHTATAESDRKRAIAMYIITERPIAKIG